MARLGTTPDAQSTCDESQNGTPSRPADESTGVYKIVKSYRIRNLDTNVLTDKGTYVKPDSSPKISIEDESEYKLIAWKTSTTYFTLTVTGRGSLHWRALGKNPTKT